MQFCIMSLFLLFVYLLSFQLVTKTTFIDGQSVSGVRGRGVRVPLWRGDVRELQGVLQESGGR